MGDKSKPMRATASMVRENETGALQGNKAF